MRRILGAVMILFALISCKSEEEEIKSNLSDLTKFSVKELTLVFEKTSDNNWVAKCEATDDITALTALYEVSPKATVSIGTVSQSSGVSVNDFTNPILYTVRAEDGSKTNFTVIITKTAAITSYKIVEMPNVQFSIAADSIVATVQNGTDVSNLTAQFTVTQGATLVVNGVNQVSESTKNNFSNPIHAILKESDGTELPVIIAIKIAPNRTPLANAGSDKLYLLQTGATNALVTLDGSASSDYEGDLASYKWLNQAGQTIGTGVTSQVSMDEGSHTVLLLVTDAAGAESTDEVLITVQTPGVLVPIDNDAAVSTKALLTKLGQVANSGKFIFGQEFPLSFKLNGLRTDLSTSDCKDVSGDHPGVYGIDPHYILYKTAEEKKVHIDEAKLAYQNGSVVTFDFHQQSRFDHQIYISKITNAKDKSLMYDIVNDLNDSRTWFYGELDQILNVINNDLGFPVVFRLWHEMNGNWFWWGSAATNHSSQLYIDFYRLTADYIKERSNLVLFGWSPSNSVPSSYYPGDTYVDLVGFDMYEPSATDLKNALVDLSVFAAQHNKVAALTEIGHGNNYFVNSPDFWAGTVLQAIKDGGSQIRIAWALCWFNATWESQQSKLYIPDINSPQGAKDYFIKFANDPVVLFEQDVKALKMYE